MRRLWPLLVASLAVCAATSPALAKTPTLDTAAVEAASFAPLPEPPAKTANPVVMKAEILLDRARFSPGAIDGIDGDNFRKAIAAYQRVSGLATSGRLDPATWDRLSSDKGPILVRYAITAKDVKGPFTRRIPVGMKAQSRLRRLGYRTVREMLAERFHLTQAALIDLNRTARFRRGEALDVPNLAVERGDAKAARVVVDKTDRSVEAFAADGKLLAVYPASIGSSEKPAPSGQFVIRRVVRNPDYTYDPAYAFKGVKARTPFTIAPGPNNPVGAVWIDLSFEGYGIHGTPNPEAIGKTESHGCIRLTNWDALDLASLVGKDTPALFQDGP